MRSLLGTVVATAIGAACLAGAGSARETSIAFACPADPSRAPLGKIYGNNRGATYCNDGATATALIVGGKRPPDLRGGVCWRNKAGDTFVNIGTEIVGKKRDKDPPGFSLSDFKRDGIVKDGASLHRGTVSWDYTVKITWTGRLGGKWAGRKPEIVGGKLTDVKASGTFSCKRFLKVPL